MHLLLFMQYLGGRYISPSEAVWRIFEFPVHKEFPPVVPLAVHLPSQQTVSFSADATAKQLADLMRRSATTLTAFFQYNSLYKRGRHLLY
jgi:hypothetical protein